MTDTTQTIPREERNWHAIEGPNGMCACGMNKEGERVFCSDLYEKARTAAYREGLDEGLATANKGKAYESVVTAGYEKGVRDALEVVEEYENQLSYTGGKSALTVVREKNSTLLT